MPAQLLYEIIVTRYRRAKVQGATYFFTVNLADRRSSLLVEEIDKLRAAYARVQTERPFKTLAMCVLPDHLHAIWVLPTGDSDYSSRWSLVKRYFSVQLPALDKRTLSLQKKREKGIWQRRFWEHQIRDDADLAEHMRYVHLNPVKHGLALDAIDWPYSSYRRWLREK